MNAIHLNFDSDTNPIDSRAYEMQVVGNPVVTLDEISGSKSCYFDGKSAIKIPQVYVGDQNFSIEAMFRPATELVEAGIFGSNGFRLAFRQDRKVPTVSFFANFPSSTDPQRAIFQYDQDWFSEHYIGIRREGSQFTVRFDNQISTIEHLVNYGSLPLYLGYFYDPMYSYVGYLRQFRMEFLDNIADVRRPIDGSIF